MGRHHLAGLPGLAAFVLALAACSSSTSTGGAPGAAGDGGAGAGDGGVGAGGEGGVPASAPLSWVFDGTPVTWGQVGFTGPKGWTAKSSASTYTLTAPATEGTCELDVLAPRAVAPGGEAAQRAQLLDVVKSAFAGHTLADPAGNATPTVGLTRGVAGQGFSFVGFDLAVDQGKFETHPYLAVFGDVAVPVAAVYDPSNGKCLTSIAGEVNEAQLFHTLTLAGFTGPSSLAASIVGDFTLSATSVLELYTIGADGSFIFTLTTDFSGSKKTTQSTGTYSLAGNVMSFFPTTLGGPQATTPYSEYVRAFEVSSPTASAGWIKNFCLLGAGDPKTTGIEACFTR